MAGFMDGKAKEVDVAQELLERYYSTKLIMREVQDKQRRYEVSSKERLDTMQDNLTWLQTAMRKQGVSVELQKSFLREQDTKRGVTEKPEIVDKAVDERSVKQPSGKPIIVNKRMSANDANHLHGGRYGVDWVYEGGIYVFGGLVGGSPIGEISYETLVEEAVKACQKYLDPHNPDNGELWMANTMLDLFDGPMYRSAIANEKAAAMAARDRG